MMNSEGVGWGVGGMQSTGVLHERIRFMYTGLCGGRQLCECVACRLVLLALLLS